MRLITDTDLTGRTDVELVVLFQMVSQALARTAPGTKDRQAVIASLQNISAARAARHEHCVVPGL